MNRLLVVGASGQVGRNMLDLAISRGNRGVGTYFRWRLPDLEPLDVRSPDSIEQLVSRVEPDVVVIPAAAANVDYCELHPDESRRVNVDGVIAVTECAVACGARVVAFSSDYVFDGSAGPYDEDAQPAPICEYGRQKLECERALLRRPGVLVIRTTWVYGIDPQEKNFAYRVLRELRAGRMLDVPVDQLGNPTFVVDLAEAVLDLVDMRVDGLVHAVGPERMDRVEFARLIAQEFGLDESLIRPVATSTLKQTAPRPLAAGMSTPRLEGLLGRKLPSPVEGLGVFGSTLRAGGSKCVAI